MKTAIYIDNGIVQLIISPESSFEKNALTSFKDKKLDAKIKQGEFFKCHANYVRYDMTSDDLMLVATEAEEVQQEGSDT